MSSEIPVKVVKKNLSYLG